MLAASVPSAPRNITLVSRSSTSLTIQWLTPLDDGGTELWGYRVYVAEGFGDYVQVAAAVSTTDPTVTRHEHTAAELTPGESYKFKVSAYNIIGESALTQLRTGQDLLGDAVDYVLAADLPEAPSNPPTVVSFT